MINRMTANLVRRWLYKCRSLMVALALSTAAGAAGAQGTDVQSEGTGASSWSVACEATARAAAPNCRMIQRAVVRETGRLLMQITIRVPAGTRKPVFLVHTPLGPFLPAGIAVDIDGTAQPDMNYQTCDAEGCLAAAPLPEPMLQSLISGQKLNITMQSLNKKPITVRMSLIGFTAAYEKIR
ncbi:invasion associated locus B family protein [Roseibium sp. SCP14]|uniref:invasion associated locus B family protein n=1 Tax=Roseibium sp. SCP14 TaxID=3141375 RepID=UPI00333B2D11